MTAKAALASQTAGPDAREPAARDVARALDLVLEGVAFIDLAGRYELVNATYARSLGYPPGELAQRPWELNVHPDDLPLVRDAALQLVRGADRALAEVRALRSDGTFFHEQVRLERRLGADGQLQGFLCVARDLTDRDASDEQARTLLAAAEGIAAADEEGHALRAAVRGVCSRAGWGYGEVWLPVSPVELRCKVWHALDAQLQAFGARTEETSCAVDEPVMGRVFSTRRAEWYTDLAQPNVPGCRRSFALDCGLRSMAAVPVVSAGEALAVLAVFSRSDALGPAPRLDLLRAVAAQLGSAVRRLRADERLRARELQLSEAQRLAHLGSWEVDLRTDRSTWSEELYRILGVQQGARPASYQSYWSHVHPEDRERVRALHQRVAAGGAHTAAFRLVRADGEVREVHGSAEIVSDGQRMVGTVLDVTEQNRIGRALRESEARYEVVDRATNDAVWDWDLTTGALHWNSGVQRLFGYDEAGLSPSHEWWTERVHDGDRERVVGQIRRVIESGGELWNAEYRFLRRDGSWAHVLDRGSVLRDGGRPVRMIGSMMDISDRKRAEEETAQALKNLEAANRELREFAYVVSHDLKAPLRGISSLASWLQADCGERLGEEGKGTLELLMGRVRRLDQLIEGILRYSRAGQVEEDRDPVDLDALLAETIDLLGARHARIEVQGKLPTVRCGRTAVGQVFQNLLSNAVKYCDKSEPLLQVGFAEEPLQFHLWVRDNGPGIEPRHFERIFQIFQTLAPRDQLESTGIGLAIVKKVVERHGGRAWVESQPGQGATFHFTLAKAGGAR